MADLLRLFVLYFQPSWKRLVACVMLVLATSQVGAQPAYNSPDPSQAVSELQHVIGMCNEVPTLEMISHFQKDIDENLSVLDSLPEAQPIATNYRQALDLIREADNMYAQTQQMRDSRVKEERGKRENELRRKASDLMKAAIDLWNQLAPILEASWEKRKRNRRPQYNEPGRLNGQNQSSPSAPWRPYSPGNPSSPSNPIPGREKQDQSDGCPLPTDVPIRSNIGLPPVQQLTGGTEGIDFKSRYLSVYPEYLPYKGSLVVHHAVPQVFARRCGQVFSWAEMHSMPNLRGICVPWELPMHQAITSNWTAWIFARGGYSATFNRAEVLQHAQEIDRQYGKAFYPRLP